METIFKVGDKVYDFRYGWGVVIEISKNDFEDYPITVQFNGSLKDRYFAIDGRSVPYEPPTLSFTEYDLVKGEFSQERPKPKFPEIDEGAVVYVGIMLYAGCYKWVTGFYRGIEDEGFKIYYNPASRIHVISYLLALENPLTNPDTPIYKA